MIAKKSGGSQSTVVCWGSACDGNFSAPVGTNSTLVEPSECVCRCLQELREFFGHPAPANSNLLLDGSAKQPGSLERVVQHVSEPHTGL